MKELILDFIIGNEKNKSSDEVIASMELTCNMLKKAIDSSSLSTPKMDDVLLQFNRTLGKANGYTEYIRQDLAIKLGLTKTAVKYLVGELLKEGCIEVIKYDNITFLKIKK